MDELIQTLSAQLKRHEGFRSHPYKDTVGKQTIGYGRNLDDRGVDQDEALYMLGKDMKTAIDDAKSLFHSFDFLTVNRQAVLANMAFNLGINRLSMFVKFRNYMASQDYASAAKEMLNSRWAQQVGPRAYELATLMENG